MQNYIYIYRLRYQFYCNKLCICSTGMVPPWDSDTIWHSGHLSASFSEGGGEFATGLKPAKLLVTLCKAWTECFSFSHSHSSDMFLLLLLFLIFSSFSLFSFSLPFFFLILPSYSILFLSCFFLFVSSGAANMCSRSCSPQ